MVFEMSMWTKFEENDAGKGQKFYKVDKTLEENFQQRHIVFNALSKWFTLRSSVYTESFNSFKRSVNLNLTIVYKNYFQTRFKLLKAWKDIRILRYMGGGSRNVHVDIGRWSMKCPCLST